MKRELKQKWVDALRSGQYQQCTTRLNDGVGFCCLGVLLDVVDPEWIELDHKFGTARGTMLCESFASEHGLDTGSFDEDREIQHQLAYLNDDEQKSFSEIADWIEANVPVESNT